MTKISSKVTLPCGQCGTEVICFKSQVPKSGVKYCSRSCADAAREKPVADRDCKHCGTSFTPHRANKNDARFCSRTCYDAHGFVETNCRVCNQVFSAYRSTVERRTVTGVACPACRATSGKPPGRPASAPKVTVQCAGCGIPVQKYARVVGANKTGRFFCTEVCRNAVGSRIRQKQDRTCRQCNAPFYPHGGQRDRFCSVICHNLHQSRTKVTRACEGCGRTFRTPKSRTTVRYCGWRCYADHRATKVGTLKANADGYVLIFDPGSTEARYGESAERGWALLHRVRMAELLGRALRPGENVHHLDGDRANNAVGATLDKVEGRWRSGNLELWTTSQPAGQRMSDRIAHARDLLESNGYAVADS